jgi:hypothetical protein
MKKIIYLNKKPTIQKSKVENKHYNHFVNNPTKYPNVIAWEKVVEDNSNLSAHFHTSHLHHDHYDSYPSKGDNFSFLSLLASIPHKLVIFIIAFCLITSNFLNHFCISGIRAPFIDFSSTMFYILGAYLGFYAINLMIYPNIYRSVFIYNHNPIADRKRAFNFAVYSGLCMGLPTYIKLWGTACAIY